MELYHPKGKYLFLGVHPMAVVFPVVYGARPHVGLGHLSQLVLMLSC